MPSIQELETMFTNRLSKNRRRLDPWARREGITCYRLYDRDIPEIPVSLDWYDGRLVAFDYGNHRGEPQFFEQLIRFGARMLGVADGDVHLKTRAKGEGGTVYSKSGEEGKLTKVSERGHGFWVNLSDYLDTGLFLDHREMRKMVEQRAKGKRFLNLFAYTGSFSVYAAAGGAAATTTVDMSRTYLEWAERNMELNGFSGDKHSYIRDDVLDALSSGRARAEYDLIVLDPPTISKSKRMKNAMDIQRDHALLINSCLELLSKDGDLFFSTNFRKFSLESDKINGTIREITRDTIPKDFRDKKIHRSWNMHPSHGGEI